MKRKQKTPDNFLGMDEFGYGLWEVWWDNGSASALAAPLVYGEPRRRSVCLTNREARVIAIAAAQKYPGKRFKVVSAHHIPDSVSHITGEVFLATEA